MEGITTNYSHSYLYGDHEHYYVHGYIDFDSIELVSKCFHCMEDGMKEIEF